MMPIRVGKDDPVESYLPPTRDGSLRTALTLSSIKAPTPEPERAHQSGDTLSLPPEAQHRRVVPRPSPPPDYGRIARFVILHKLGEGGMGVVFAAYDEELDRKVAIKLIRSRGRSESARLRLQREAQGLAQLSHPNVVQVYDTGFHEDMLFVAMEFIPGRDLHVWLKQEQEGEQPSSWRERLEIMIQAGRGLEAAHLAGMVHRDFKPGNALLGDDGRVRVLDFGLVRGTESSPAPRGPEVTQSLPTEGELEGEDTLDSSPPELDEVATPRPSRRMLERTLTRVGAVMGTPAYMAPEQHLGQPCEAPADQFAYCVSLFEVLFGERPFSATTLDELLEKIETGEMIEPDLGEVPREVHDAIIRGLARDPEQRWASMGELLAVLELACQPPPKSRTGWWVAALGLAATGLGAGLLLAPDRVPELCQIDEAALNGVWDPQRRAELQAAFAASPAPFASTSASTVAARLDDFANQWVERRRESCADTQIHGTASTELLDRRNACLDRARAEFGALVDSFSKASDDPAVIREAPGLLGALPDLSRCARPGAQTLKPAGAELEIDAAYADLTRAHVAIETGAFADADALIEGALLLARERDYLPLELESRMRGAQRVLASGSVDEGAATLLELIQLAMGADLDEFEAQARGQAALQLVDHWSKPDLEALLVDEFGASLERLEAPPLELKLARADVRGRLAYARGEYELALQHYTKMRELGPTPLELRFEQVQPLLRLGRLDEAEAELRAGLSSAVEQWGEGCMLAAFFEYHLALVAIEAGQFDHARTGLTRARAQFDALLEPGNLESAKVRFAESRLALNEGAFEAMRPELEAIREIFVAELGATHELTGQVDNALGVTLFFLADYDSSLLAYERALVAATATHGPDHQEVGELHSNIGESQAALGDHRAALRSYARALAVFERVLGPDHPAAAYAHKGRGQSLLALARPEEAKPALERALELHGPGAPPFELADIRLALAGALMASADRDEAETQRARALAEQAAQTFAEFGLDDYLTRARALTE